MARPIRRGLDYFPLDVNIFDDDKLKFVSVRFAERGELIAIKLLCKIYNNGYYINWDQDVATLFSKSAGENVAPGLANDVVDELLKRGFFNATLYKRFSILTSGGIQKRYLRICADAKRVDYEIPAKHLCPGITPEETTQRKGKKKKENESKEDEKKGEDLDVRKLKFASTLSPFKQMYSDEMIKDFYEYWTESNKTKTRFRQENERNWDVGQRLKIWAKHELVLHKEKQGAQKESKILGAMRAGEAAINYFENLNNATSTPSENN